MGEMMSARWALKQSLGEQVGELVADFVSREEMRYRLSGGLAWLRQDEPSMEQFVPVNDNGQYLLFSSCLSSFWQIINRIDPEQRPAMTLFNDTLVRTQASVAVGLSMMADGKKHPVVTNSAAKDMALVAMIWFAGGCIRLDERDDRAQELAELDQLFCQPRLQWWREGAVVELADGVIGRWLDPFGAYVAPAKGGFDQQWWTKAMA